MQERGRDLIAAAGWAAVYTRDGAEFLWPLVGWLRPAPGTPAVLVGLTLTPDGRAVVRADQIEGFKRYAPPAGWLAEAAATR